MPAIAPFIAPITAFNGILQRDTKDWNTPENISFIPLHAFFQLPVNTPVKNVMIPSNIFKIPDIMPFAEL